MHLSWADGQTDRSSGRCQGICDGDNVDTEVCSLSNASLLVKSSTFCGFSGWRSGRLAALISNYMQKYCLKIPIWNEASIRNVQGLLTHSIKICRVLISFAYARCIAWVKHSMIREIVKKSASWACFFIKRIESVNARDTSTFKRGRRSWAFVKSAMGWGWRMAPFEWRWLSRTVRACCWGRVAILIHVLSK